MADSENSRTLPAITRRKTNPKGCAAEKLPRIIDRRNLLPVAARLLSARVVEPGVQRRAPGPTPVRELWPQWYALYQEQMRAYRFRKKLEAEMLNNSAGLSVALQIEGTDQPVAVHSFDRHPTTVLPAGRRTDHPGTRRTSATSAIMEERRPTFGVQCRCCAGTRPRPRGGDNGPCYGDCDAFVPDRSDREAPLVDRHARSRPETQRHPLAGTADHVEGSHPYGAQSMLSNITKPNLANVPADLKGALLALLTEI